LAVGQFVTPSAYVAAGTYVHDISGSTVTFSLPLLGSGITGFTANNIYQNNSAGLQEIVITGTGVTFTNVYKIIGSTYVPVGTYDESATLAPATVLLGPGQMFTASWSAGTPLFAVNQLS